MAFSTRQLLKDDQAVQAIGIGGGWGISGKALDLALEGGINYFFWGPTFPTYWKMGRWLKARFRTDRSKIILGTVSYFWKFPGAIERIVHRHLRWLGTDYLDYFHLGMLRSEDREALDRLLKLKEQGKIRQIAFSSHDRKLAAKLAQKWPVDLAMIRYNAANRGAEAEFFPLIDAGKLKVVVFNATRHKSLLKAPAGWDLKKPVPSAGDCYRFVLTHPKAGICLAGPSDENQVREILQALAKGPMSEEELKWMKEFGDAVYGRK
jgi:aryl-alcohol dehydrogenase-like predicted oxidoreductase